MKKLLLLLLFVPIVSFGQTPYSSYYENGNLKEIFGAGTAAVINPIAGFSYKGDYFELPKLADSIAVEIKTKLTNIQNKLAEDTFGWTVKI